MTRAAALLFDTAPVTITGPGVPPEPTPDPVPNPGAVFAWPGPNGRDYLSELPIDVTAHTWRTVPVSTAAELHAAYANALPWDKIECAAGVYRGCFAYHKDNGTGWVWVTPAPGADVVLRSDRSKRYTNHGYDARGWLFGPCLNDGGTLTIDGDDHAFNTAGCGLISGTKEDSLTDPDHGPCQDIAYYRTTIRNGGYNLNKLAYDVERITYANCTFVSTGAQNIGYGEGTYIGSASRKTSAGIDRTRDIRLLGCQWSQIVAECIDIKPGVVGLEIRGCLFVNNHMQSTTTHNKAAIAARAGTGTPIIIDCLFLDLSDNGAPESWGGGIYATTSFRAINCIFAGLDGEAIWIQQFESGMLAELEHCTFWNGTGANRTFIKNAYSGRSPDLGSIVFDACLFPSWASVQNKPEVSTVRCGIATAADFVGPLVSPWRNTDYGDVFALAAGSGHRLAVAPQYPTDVTGRTRPNPADRGAHQSA